MEFPERISEKLTGIIARNLTDMPEDKLEQINYGIAVFIINSYKYILIFLAAYLLKIFNYVLLTLLGFGLLRSFAAGLHGTKEWTCLLSTVCFVFGTVYLSINTNINFYLLVTLYTAFLVIVYKYAPADTEERPIYSKSYRSKMKLLSCSSVLLLLVLSIWFYGSPLSNIFVLTTAAEAFLIMPVSYKLVNSVYGTGLNKNKEEV